MFARWTKGLRALSVVAAAATASLVAPSPARALEGIQGRHAIFYPSLELVYQHDDNFFLAPSNEVTADSFLAKAHFRVEVPGARQYVAFEYAPHYRNVNISRSEYFRAYGHTNIKDYDGVQHDWNLRARLRGSSVFKVDIDHDLYLGLLESHELDEGREFVDQAGDDFLRHRLGIAFKWEGNRQKAKIFTGIENTDFDHPDDPLLAPAWFELSAWKLGAEYGFKFAPLTSFIVGFQHDDGQQDYTAKVWQVTGVPTLDSSRETLYFGFDGEMGRTTTGRATLGFSSLDYDAVNSSDSWDGVVLNANVTKAFSRYTKLIFNANRQPFYSGFAPSAGEFNTYFVGTNASFTLTNQPQGGKVMWSLIGQYHRNSYDTEVNDMGVMREREDDIARLRAEIGFHPIQHVSFRLNYQWEERQSNLKSPGLDYDYEDNLVIFQVQFGF